MCVCIDIHSPSGLGYILQNNTSQEMRFFSSSDNSHSFYATAQLKDGVEALNRLIDDLREANFVDFAEGNRPDGSDTSVVALTNLTVFSYKLCDRKNFGAARSIPRAIRMRPDITTLVNTAKGDCLFWAIALGLNKNLTWASQTSIFEGRELVNQMVPLPDWEQLTGKMESIRSKWILEVSETETSIAQFPKAEEVFQGLFNNYVVNKIDLLITNFDIYFSPRILCNKKKDWYPLGRNC